MIQTVTIGSCVQIQGMFVRKLDNGKVVISVDNREYEGMPVKRPN